MLGNQLSEVQRWVATFTVEQKGQGMPQHVAPPAIAQVPQVACPDALNIATTDELAEDRVTAVAYATELRAEEKLDLSNGEKRFPARRWVVERALGKLVWLSTCRALLVRYDKHSANFLGLLQFACALLWFRRLHCLSHLHRMRLLADRVG